MDNWDEITKIDHYKYQIEPQTGVWLEEENQNMFLKVKVDFLGQGN